MNKNSMWILKGYISSMKNGKFLRITCYGDITRKENRVDFLVFREDIEKILRGERRCARVYMINLEHKV